MDETSKAKAVPTSAVEIVNPRSRPNLLVDAPTFDVDPETGFMQSSRHDGISASRKAEIIELFRKTGNLNLSCRQMGVEPRVIRWHLERDPAFKDAHRDAYEDLTDNAEGAVVANFMKTPADRIFWLKSHRQEVYGDRPQIVNHNVTLVKNIAEKVDSFNARKQGPALGGPTA